VSFQPVAGPRQYRQSRTIAIIRQSLRHPTTQEMATGNPMSMTKMAMQSYLTNSVAWRVIGRMAQTHLNRRMLTKTRMSTDTKKDTRQDSQKLMLSSNTPAYRNHWHVMPTSWQCEHARRILGAPCPEPYGILAHSSLPLLCQSLSSPQPRQERDYKCSGWQLYVQQPWCRIRFLMTYDSSHTRSQSV
jgi:hypothetical protein